MATSPPSASICHEQADVFDRRMSRHPAVWLCLMACAGISLAGLQAVGMLLPLATVITSFFVSGLVLSARSAYLWPRKFTRRTFFLSVLAMLLATYGLATIGTLAGWWPATGALFSQVAPAYALGACGAASLLGALSAGQYALLRLEHEQLQAQISTARRGTNRLQARAQEEQAKVVSLASTLTNLQPLIDAKDAHASQALRALTRSLHASSEASGGHTDGTG